MTWNNPPKLDPILKRTSIPVTPEQIAGKSEGSQQKALMVWAAMNYSKYPQLKYLFHIPNGGSRDIREAVELKAQGVKAGVPDLFLPYPKMNRWFMLGLFIELKVGKNKTSSEQDDWIKYLTETGYYCAVCYSWEVARDVIVKYLEGKL